MKKNAVVFFILISFIFQANLMASLIKRFPDSLRNPIYSTVNELLKALEGNANYFILRSFYEKVREPLFRIGKPLEYTQKGHRAPKEAQEQINYLRDIYHRAMMNAHDRFYKYNYLPWKNSLSDEKKAKYEQAIKAYEQAYKFYKANHLSEQANNAIVVCGEHISHIIYDQKNTRYIAF